ncbi:hypothetical protein [Agromyces aureus]|nr:hypothetical protein [Agromyces aureus]
MSRPVGRGIRPAVLCPGGFSVPGPAAVVGATPELEGVTGRGARD